MKPAITRDSAPTSACEKGGQWQPAPPLLSEMWVVRLEPAIIGSNNAQISACEKGEPWHPALALLSEMWAAKPELAIMSYSAQ